MFRKCHFLAASIAAWVMIAAPAANANALCGKRDQIVSVLGDKYAESRHAMGLLGQDGSGIMEIFVSKKGSWTMLVTMAKGQTCIMAAGQSWDAMAGLVTGTGI